MERLITSKKKTYKCRNCNKVWVTTLEDFLNHKLTHTSKVKKSETKEVKGLDCEVDCQGKPFECDICGKKFTRSTVLDYHKKLHSTQKVFKCDVCKEEFSDSCELKQHRTCHSTEKLLGCEVCGKKFKSSANFKTHKKVCSLHVKKSFKCDVCNKVLNSMRNLKRHIKIHRDKTCNLSDKAPKQAGNVKQSHKVCTDKKCFKCDVCDKAFDQASKLEVHKKLHTGKEYLFKKSDQLEQHKQVAGQLFKCDVCHKVFNKASILELHKKLYPDETSFKCDACDKVFHQSGHLEQHKKLHSGEMSDISSEIDNLVVDVEPPQIIDSTSVEKLFKCDVCDNFFNKANELEQHKKLHVGQKIFVCTICGETFEQTSHLDQHKRLHTTETVFKCDLCDNIFSNPVYLNQHRKLHGIFRKFKCDICEKRFTRASNLKVHTLNVHMGEKIYKCDVCHKEYGYSKSLKQHKISHAAMPLQKTDVPDKVPKRIMEVEEPKDGISSSDNPSASGVANAMPLQRTDVPDKVLPKKAIEVEQPKSGVANVMQLPVSDKVQSKVFKKVLKCDVCHQHFRYLSVLRRHKMSHVAMPLQKILVPVKTMEAVTYIPSSDKPSGVSNKKFIPILPKNALIIDFVKDKLLNTSDNKMSLKCGECDMVLEHASDIKRHHDIHKKLRTGGKTFKCDVCDNESETNKICCCEYLFECDVCHKFFNKASDLGQHKKVHTDGKTVKCGAGDKVLHQSDQLERHRKVHSSENSSESNISDSHINDLDQHKLLHEKSSQSNMPVLHCAFCDKEIFSLWALKQHIKTHIGENSFKCSRCGKEIERALDIKQHEKLHTPNGNDKCMKCDLCDKEFNQPGRLRRHRRIHTGEKPFDCDVCCKTFRDSSNLRAHQRRYCRGPTQENDGCPKDPPNEDTINRNIAGNIFKCDVCNKAFNQESELWQHKTVHSGEQSSECDVCKKTVSQTSGIEQHKKGDTIKCDTCVKVVNKVMSEQRAEHHTVERLSSKCDVSSEVFNQASGSLDHKRIANTSLTVVKSLKCSECDSVFSQVREFEQHAEHRTDAEQSSKRNETSKLPLAKVFNQTSAESLSNPGTANTKSIPTLPNTLNVGLFKVADASSVKFLFKCCSCYKVFNQPSDYEQHKHLHHGGRPPTSGANNKKFIVMLPKQFLKCHVCNKLFNRAGDLEEHKKIHNEEGPLKCRACDKVFTDVSDLEQHKKLHTDENKLEPVICKEVYSQASGITPETS